MGIDLLDMTFRIEKSFGIRMPRDAWLEIAGVNRGEITSGFDVTAGQLYDFILSRLNESPDRFRPPRVSRDLLLDRLSLFFNRSPGDIGMETELEQLLSHPDRRAEWFDLARFLETNLPAVRRPVWLFASIALRAMTMLAIGLTLAPQRNSAAAWPLALAMTAVVWFVALVFTAAEATVIPRQCRTVADLHRFVNDIPGKLEVDDPAPWTRRDVWEALQDLLVECLAVEREEVTTDARLIADLGAD